MEMPIEKVREFFAKDRFATLTTGINIEEVSKHYSICTLKIEEKHLAALDQVMGGVIYTLADFAFAVAANEPTSCVVTVNSSIDYINSPKNDYLVAECKCIKDGKRVCFYETIVNDGLGNVVAKVSTSGMHI